MIFGKACQDNQNIRAIEKAEGRINRELDIVNFIKSQKYLQVIMKTLFTKLERHLICHNKALILKKGYTKALFEETESSDIEENPGNKF